MHMIIRKADTVPSRTSYSNALDRRFPDIQIWTAVFCWWNTGADFITDLFY